MRWNELDWDDEESLFEYRAAQRAKTRNYWIRMQVRITEWWKQREASHA